MISTQSIPEQLYVKDLSGKFIYIRHGQTKYNHDSSSANKKIIKTNPDYLDSRLSQKGVEQAKHITTTVNALDIEEVFVSPLYRALQTVTLLLENHPQVKDITVKVHPLITETVSGVHDFAKNIQQSKKDFNMSSKVKIDWSLFDEIFKDEKHQDMYFLDYIDALTDKQKEEIFSKLNNTYTTHKKDFPKALGLLSKYGVDLGLPRLETLTHLFKRNLEFKQFLKDKFSSTMSNVNKKVLIITHSSFTKLSTSLLAYKMDTIEDFPSDIHKMGNCEMISMLI